MAQLATTRITGFDDYRNHVAELERLQAVSNGLPEGEVVGGVIQFQIADGYAYYLVTAENPLTVQHIPFGDGYQVSHILIRGLIKADVLEMLAREKRIRAFFQARSGKAAG